MYRLFGEVNSVAEAGERLEQFFRLALDMVCIVNRQGVIVRVNPLWQEILGYSTEEVESHRMISFVHPDDYNDTYVKLSAVDSNQNLLNLNNRLKHKDGTYRHFNWHIYRQGDYIFGAARDITDKVEAEQRLNQLTTRLQLATRAGQVGTFEWDIKTNEMIWDERMYELAGMSTGNNYVLFEEWSKRVHPEDLPKTAAEITHALQENRDYFLEFRVVLPNHSLRYIRALGKIFTDGAGQANRIFGCCWDISESKKMEAGWEKTRKELESFSYSVSHDLRSPLRGIVGWSQAIVEDYADKLDEQGKEYLMRVQQEALRMGTLIDDLLKLSRISQKELVHVPVAISAMAGRVADRLKHEQPDRSIEFSIQPDLSTLGDPELIEVLLTNLLSNAVKFTGKRPHAKIAFGERLASDQLVAFYVEDNGAGFDVARARNLFGAFQRMHRQSEFPGTGIGLATVARVVNLHQGTIWADAAVDKGATFYFRLIH